MADKPMDIKTLRQLGRDPKYCNSVKEGELDTILQILLADNNHGTKLTVAQKIDIIATVSNIVLINRQLHLSYFIPKYSKDLFIYCNMFVKLTNQITTQQDFQDLVPMYRMIFLTLYGALSDVGDEIINDVFNVLFKGFNDCMKILDSCCDDIYFQLLLIEILKCLYTLHHKYHYGSNLIQDEDFSDDCVNIVNTYSQKQELGRASDNHSLLIKNSFNFLLVLFSEREETKTTELFNGPKELYLTFFSNIDSQLQNQLSSIIDSNDDSSKKEHYPLLVNQLVILNHMSKLLLGDLKDSKDQKFRELLAYAGSIVLPDAKSSFTYNQFVRILVSSAFPNLSTTQTFPEMQQLSFVKELVLGLFYTLSYDPDPKKHQTKFFELAGFLNANAYTEKFNILVESSIDLEKLARPTNKYLDKELLEAKTPLYLDSATSSSEKSPMDDLSEEDKEREAEKLFVLFDRMENLRTFENFKNPVRQWQQEGKFEDLDTQ